MRTISSNETRQRPRTCQRPVIPGKAAKRLATSQPAVSRAIGDLEYSLGVRLLDRGQHGIVPKPYGRALIRRSVAASMS